MDTALEQGYRGLNSVVSSSSMSVGLSLAAGAGQEGWKKNPGECGWQEVSRQEGPTGAGGAELPVEPAWSAPRETKADFTRPGFTGRACRGGLEGPVTCELRDPQSCPQSGDTEILVEQSIPASPVGSPLATRAFPRSLRIVRG